MGIEYGVDSLGCIGRSMACVDRSMWPGRSGIGGKVGRQKLCIGVRMIESFELFTIKRKSRIVDLVVR